MNNRDWFFKYGLDYLCHYGEVSIETISKHLDIETDRIKWESTPTYKSLREKLKELEK